jgi:hypothetical protein
MPQLLTLPVSAIWDSHLSPSRSRERVKLSFKTFFHSKCEVRILGNNSGHKGSGALEGIKSKKSQ